MITSTMIEEILQDNYIFWREHGTPEQANEARTIYCDYRSKIMGLVE